MIIFSYHYLFASIAGIIAILVEARYIYTILTWKTIPNFSGWCIMSISMSCIFISSYFAWGWASIWLIGVLACLHIFEFIIAYFYGVFRFTKLDITLLTVAVLSMVLWYFTNSPTYVIVINTFVDALGMTLIGYKLYRFPETEDKIAWIMSDSVYFIDLFAIENFTIADSFFVIVNVCVWFIMVLLTFRKMTFFRRLYFHVCKFLHIKV